jgi:hypothetical protein
MPKAFYVTHCVKCDQEILSVYGPDSWFHVYCETCYAQEFYK